MSEMISTDEQRVEPVGVVELGTASEKTRGSAFVSGLFDGGQNYPFVFYR